ncbi:hypothetical protein LP417_10710 [Polaromonas sp. P1-6]|nr:hypothetical protein LP417_10710 [Polaromonas sp. P1-6]
MRTKFVTGVSLLLAVASSFAGSASGQFVVKVTVKSADNANSGICIGTTTSGAGSSSIQVRCSPGIAVSVSQTGVRIPGRFMPGYRPAQDSLLPDYCRSEISRGDQAARITCRLDDQRQLSAGNETDEGWEIESRLYAVNTEDAQTQTARLRLQEDRGVLTALRLASANGRSGPVEMLVSF